MHELGITQEIIALVSERTGGAAVRRVVLEIGKLSAVLPDAVQFCFDLCSAGTPVEGARLEIVEIPGRACCRACGAEFTLEQPYGQCGCGNTDLRWLVGQELTIREVELA
jgi:hydrogenase nickel incorporation protein HypA/HybF